MCGSQYLRLKKAKALINGNKLTAFVTSVTSPHINKWYFVTMQAIGVEFMEGPVSDKISKKDFKNSLRLGSDIIN